MSRLSEFLKDLKHQRDARRGRLPERHLNQPGIRPDQIATGTITPEHLAAGDPREDRPQ